jgi:hypothetical protein
MNEAHRERYSRQLRFREIGEGQDLICAPVSLSSGAARSAAVQAELLARAGVGFGLSTRLRH